MELLEFRDIFQKIFLKNARHEFFAPGRINLIVEHTDYNGGNVFLAQLLSELMD